MRMVHNRDNKTIEIYCYPHPSDFYEVDLEEITEKEHVINWIHHLMDKNWMQDDALLGKFTRMLIMSIDWRSLK